jgi:hypothetical protein
MVAEADGNRTRQGPIRPLTGFEDRGTHQASGRLHGGRTSLGLPDSGYEGRTLIEQNCVCRYYSSRDA